jgi:single stranded DNA-binding protein
VVAVNTYGRPSRGGDSADFYKVETWGKLAELAGQYLAKGNQVAVSGRLLFDRWTDKQGKNRFTPVVEAAQLSLPSRLKVVDSVNEVDSPAPAQASAANVVTGSLAFSDDDVSIEETEASVPESDSLAEMIDTADGEDPNKKRGKPLKARSA